MAWIPVVALAVAGCQSRPFPRERGGKPLAWHTDVAEARREAVARHRPVYMVFTGSDWCPPCQSLDHQVHETPVFREFARRRMVLLKIDFPQTRLLPEAEAEANRVLAESYRLRGYPTVLVTGARGEVLWRQDGYRGEDGAAHVTVLRQIPVFTGDPIGRP